MAEELAALIDAEAGPYLIQVEFDDAGGVGSMCAKRSPHLNPWHPRKRLAEITEEILAVAPGSTCLAGTRIDFNLTGAKYSEIDAAIEQCESQSLPGLNPSTPSRLSTEHAARFFRRCIERAQIQRGEIWGGESSSGRPWGLIPGHFYIRSADGAERATALRTCTTNTTPPLQSSSDAVIQRVIVNFDEVEDCMQAQGWERPL
jgi:hypothetical protein